jgi:uncharacterized protein YjbJ (UPF0337 family)
MWNKAERDGKVDQTKGKIKQAVAAVTKDDDLKAEGKADEAAGRAKENVGRVVRKVGEAVEEVGQAIKK